MIDLKAIATRAKFRLQQILDSYITKTNVKDQLRSIHRSHAEKMSVNQSTFE